MARCVIIVPLTLHCSRWQAYLVDKHIDHVPDDVDAQDDEDIDGLSDAQAPELHYHDFYPGDTFGSRPSPATAKPRTPPESAAAAPPPPLPPAQPSLLAQDRKGSRPPSPVRSSSATNSGTASPAVPVASAGAGATDAAGVRRSRTPSKYREEQSMLMQRLLEHEEL